MHLNSTGDCSLSANMGDNSKSMLKLKHFIVPYSPLLKWNVNPVGRKPWGKRMGHADLTHVGMLYQCNRHNKNQSNAFYTHLHRKSESSHWVIYSARGMLIWRTYTQQTIIWFTGSTAMNSYPRATLSIGSATLSSTVQTHKTFRPSSPKLICMLYGTGQYISPAGEILSLALLFLYHYTAPKTVNRPENWPLATDYHCNPFIPRQNTESPSAREINLYRQRYIS